jgi:hypothetical protein
MISQLTLDGQLRTYLVTYRTGSRGKCNGWPLESSLCTPLYKSVSIGRSSGTLNRVTDAEYCLPGGYRDSSRPLTAGPVISYVSCYVGGVTSLLVLAQSLWVPPHLPVDHLRGGNGTGGRTGGRPRSSATSRCLHIPLSIPIDEDAPLETRCLAYA